MFNVSRGSAFWVLLIVAALLPATLLASKQLYAAKIFGNGGTGPGGGTATIVVQSTGYEYMVRTMNRPNQITQVRLEPVGSAWSIVLCDSTNEPVEDNCLYAPDGNIDIEGAITPMHMIPVGVSGRQFIEALRNGQLQVVLSDGSAGTFTRII